MRFRRLRIAWSMAWGVIAVALCVLWVRSYQATDLFRMPFCISTDGRFVIWLSEDTRVPYSTNATIGLSSETLLRMSRIDANGEPFRVDPFASKSGFCFDSDYHATILQLPFWFLVLTFSSGAVLPWLPVKRFSLCTLLIAITLGCIGFGLLGWTVR